MNMNIGLQITTFLLALLGLTRAFDPSDSKVEDFDVHPGSTVQEHKLAWDGVSCEFIWECEGGTNEKWVFSMHRNEDKTEYSCTVERPSGTSYLFFENFEMEAKFMRVYEVYAESQSGRTLSPSEFSLDTSANKVSSVEGEFKSQLAKLTIIGSKSKEEL